MTLQEKKKKHTRTLKVSNYHVGPIQPYSAEIMAESRAKLDELAEADNARMRLEEAKNKVESYIYHIRNKLIDDEEEIGKVTSEEQRDALRQSTEDAEEWMWDAEDDLKTWEDKYTELAEPAEKAFFRMAELAARPKAIEALTAKLGKVEDLMKKWETSMEHITEEERQEVLDKVQDVRAWVDEKVKAQEEADPTGDVVFTSEEVPGQTKKIEGIVARLMKKPKPKPEKKNETSAEKVSFLHGAFFPTSVIAHVFRRTSPIPPSRPTARSPRRRSRIARSRLKTSPPRAKPRPIPLKVMKPRLRMRRPRNRMSYKQGLACKPPCGRIRRGTGVWLLAFVNKL